MQEQAESIDTFITTLRAFAKTRDFGTLKDDLICDRIVCSVRENGIGRKLLQVSGLTLLKCVDICRANEATAAKLNQTQSTKKKITRGRRHPNKCNDRIFNLSSSFMLALKICKIQHRKLSSAKHKRYQFSFNHPSCPFV